MAKFNYFINKTEEEKLFSCEQQPIFWSSIIIELYSEWRMQKGGFNKNKFFKNVFKVYFQAFKLVKIASYIQNCLKICLN